MFFQPSAIDRRLPSLEDSQLWLELMRRYRIVGHTWAFLHMVPAERTRTLTLPLASFDATMGERFDVPPSPATAGVGEDPAREPPARPPRGRSSTSRRACLVEITLANGIVGKVRLITAIAADGFLLSPTLASATTSPPFSSASSGRHNSINWRSAALRIVAEPDALAQLYFKPTLHVDLSELSTPPGAATTRQP